MQTLPERSQKDHWKFLYKNKNKYGELFVQHTYLPSYPPVSAKNNHRKLKL